MDLQAVVVKSITLLSYKNNPRSNWLAIKTRSYTPKNSGGQHKGPVQQEVLEAIGGEQHEPGPHDAWPALSLFVNTCCLCKCPA